jgi:hypothetical protein
MPKLTVDRGLVRRQSDAQAPKLVEAVADEDVETGLDERGDHSTGR